MWMGRESQMCVYHEFCGKAVALEHDGSLYSCDHYVYPEYKLGNITETESSRMVFSERQQQVGFNKFRSLPQQCRHCKYLFACNGECPKNRCLRSRDGEPGLNYLCSGLYKFWEHIDKDVQEICKRVARGDHSGKDNSLLCKHNVFLVLGWFSGSSVTISGVHARTAKDANPCS